LPQAGDDALLAEVKGDPAVALGADLEGKAGVNALVQEVAESAFLDLRFAGQRSGVRDVGLLGVSPGSGTHAQQDCTCHEALHWRSVLRPHSEGKETSLRERNIPAERTTLRFAWGGSF